MKVLVIDDSAIVLELVKAALEELGCIVITLNTPLGAPIIAGLERPNLILVDMAMASMTGEQVVKGLRARGRLPTATRIILFSDRPESELTVAAGRCGADGWLRKSADRTQMMAALRDIASASPPVA